MYTTYYYHDRSYYIVLYKKRKMKKFQETSRYRPTTSRDDRVKGTTPLPDVRNIP